MRKIVIRSIAAVASIAAMASLAACGDNTSTSGNTASGSNSSSSELSGEFQGKGASSQKTAVQTWTNAFQDANPNVKIGYDPSGSGAGVTAFLQGSAAWAGSDAALTADQVKQSSDKACAAGTTAFDVPVYVSPIAVIFNLDGISGQDKHLNLDAATIAKIFDGKITKWNDSAITEQNPGVNLPAKDITVVHRSDKSGTTKNFLDYVQKAGGKDNWNYEVGENWPNEVGQAAKGTDGVVNTVKQADGTIGYADGSAVGSLGTVAVKVGEKYVAYNEEGSAAKTLDDSQLDSSAEGANRVVVNINRTTSADGAYPVILVSYMIACPSYQNDKNDTAKFVKSWLTYVTSDEGQKAAAEDAGSSPISDTLRAKVTESINAIK
ncbi:phosphate ABC transporter substrate-binding protein PstS [Bifidobacterium avesanii]|uniref:Phosphate-binding protein n=1 Tax=Bifidobacterium avesanii TaxID=1798157 RepID=A0A7K3TKS7_9BIFI|nr:phosphate ABC transporter substrate-binding protein PstS [Bifidobacterium avesanii]KAB8290916.1 phosphate-binding transporter of ABC transporter system [Bifidobacterium avesanii]NEG78873.1 phosphate ABC transporter substrate-binding protein PstS [Bifidobacterium avesanii]